MNGLPDLIYAIVGVVVTVSIVWIVICYLMKDGKEEADADRLRFWAKILALGMLASTILGVIFLALAFFVSFHEFALLCAWAEFGAFVLYVASAKLRKKEFEMIEKTTGNIEAQEVLP
jgi:multisubunit Na+/H+ antiporter MnhB subunit